MFGNTSDFTLNIDQIVTNDIQRATINYAEGQSYAQNLYGAHGDSPFTYGEFNAGEFEVVWVAMGSPNNQTSMNASLTSCGPPISDVQTITLGRVGIQTGLFP